MIDILRKGTRGSRVDGSAVKAASQEIARRYEVTQIEALRAIHYYLGGVAADSRLHEMPPDALYVADRPALQRQYRIAVYRAPAGSRMTDDYRLVEIDTATGARRNILPLDWAGAIEQARALYGISPDEWSLVVSDLP